MGLLSLKDQAKGQFPGSKPPQRREMVSVPYREDGNSTRKDLHKRILREIDGWLQEKVLEWEERAAIREFDGLLPREEAEIRAFFDLTGERNENE